MQKDEERGKILEKILLQLFAEAGVLADIFLAAVLGFVIGTERRFRGKEAGIKTHTIVSIGAALMMAVSMYAFDGADTARVAAQIVSGVGFLGAGIIIYKKFELYGLTTAAGIWATAGVGMACVGRLYVIAVGTTLIMIVLQFIFHMEKGIFKSHRYYSVMITFIHKTNEHEIIKSLFDITRFNKLVIERKDDHMCYHAVLHTTTEYSSSHLAKIMEENPFILTVERVDDT